MAAGESAGPRAPDYRLVPAASPASVLRALPLPVLLALFGLPTLVGCVESRPLPDVGDCAVYPSGSYEYGQIGIGTCLAAPADIVPLDTDGQFAVVNANAWSDFTGGSVTVVDLGNVDTSLGRQTMTGIGATAVDLPSFSGAGALLEDGVLAVTNRLSEGARTREAEDDVYFVDLSDPAAPALAEGLTESGSSIGVGYDPNAIVYDPATHIGYVLDRTAHQITMLDMAARPVAIIPPGGDASVDGYPFDDVDGSGSRASFAALENADGTSLSPTAWELRWEPGTIRAWRPSTSRSPGLSRITGNGEGAWTATPGDPDVPGNGLGDLNDPFFFLDLDNVPHLLYIDDDSGGIDVLDGDSSMITSWTTADPLLATEANGSELVLGGPTLYQQSGLWSLFYDAGDGQTQFIAAATSTDGADYTREGAVVSLDGASLTDPFVLYDASSERYRMWFTVDDGADGVPDGIGEAWSDDLVSWTMSDSRFEPAGGAQSPAVTWLAGQFHMLYTVPGLPPIVAEATSVDGTTWTPKGKAFETTGLDRANTRVAVQGTDESTFSILGANDQVFDVALTPGDEIQNPVDGFTLRVAAGQRLDPDDAGDYSAGGVQLDCWVGSEAYVTLTDADGVQSIGRGSLVGDTFSLETEPVLQAPSTLEGLSHAVVVDEGSQLRMYVAGTSNGLTSVYSATSVDDGTVWTLDETPVLAPGADWESVGTIPGSAVVLDDGTLQLWYTGTDGGNPKIGLAESTDGITFTRVSGADDAWMLNAGGPGDWDDSGVQDPMAQVDSDGVVHLWFAGSDGNQWSLGYAEDADGLDGSGGFQLSTNIDEETRAIMSPTDGSFGVSDLVRPVTVPTNGGWTLWYTGLDVGVGRSGRAILHEPDRAWRDAAMPTRADTWGFVVQPEDTAQAIDLDVTVEGTSLAPVRGCSALARDDVRGFLYVTCKLLPEIFVVDIRDDTDTDQGGTFVDLNYLDVESVIVVETSTGGSAGPRAAVVDNEHGWLWTVSDTPSSLIAFDLSMLVDDEDIELVHDSIVSMLPLPIGNTRDEGVNTQADVGPGQLAMHPDGHHLFVTNFNDNSVSCYDLSVGTAGTLVGEATEVGENPYAIALTPDGTRGLVGNYSGEVEGTATHSTLFVLDTDPESPTFMQPLTWLVNK